MQKAYAMLEHDGVIYSLPGKGSFMAGPEQAMEKRRAQALEQVRRAVSEALDCGVSRNELLEILQAHEHLKKEDES